MKQKKLTLFIFFVLQMRFHIQDYDTLKGRVDFMRK